MRILIVEDETKLAEALAKTLRAEAYAVDLVQTGTDAEEVIFTEDYDLVLLDWGLPDEDGIEVCRKIRQAGKQTLVLMLTARDASVDKITGLNVGADDYVVKPFDLEELLARIRSLLRRKSGISQEMLSINDLELNQTTRQVTKAGKIIQLTAKEYALLDYLMCHAGSIVSKEEILTHVWDMNADPFSKVVDVYIGYLRAKLGKKYILTIKGLGYRLE